MSADLEAQIAIRLRLIASGVNLHVENNILDRNARQALLPSIVIGEATVVDEGTSLARRITRVTHTLHVWVKSTSREDLKRIMQLMRASLMSGRLTLQNGYHVIDGRVVSTRAVSDPDGETAHGVFVYECLVQEPT